MACPHVAGAALALWNQFPDCTNEDIRDALESGADDLGAPGRDDEFGEGRLNYYESYDILAAACGSETNPNPCFDSPLPVRVAPGVEIFCEDVVDLCESPEIGDFAKSHCPL